MTTFTKSKDNLRRDGNRVISYATHVATIDEAAGVLYVHGYWSRTTSKHITIVATDLGLRKVEDYERKHSA